MDPIACVPMIPDTTDKMCGETYMRFKLMSYLTLERFPQKPGHDAKVRENQSIYEWYTRGAACENELMRI